jgi:hypothetical protein
VTCARPSPGTPWCAGSTASAFHDPAAGAGPGTASSGSPAGWRDGFIDTDLLKAAPKKRDNDDLLTVVAGIVKGMRRRNEEPTLAAIGKALEDMHQRMTRGGSRWRRKQYAPSQSNRSFLIWIRVEKQLM